MHQSNRKYLTGKEVEEVKGFKYLGSTVSENDEMEEDGSHGVREGSRMMGSLDWLWSSESPSSAAKADCRGFQKIKNKKKTFIYKRREDII